MLNKRLSTGSITEMGIHELNPEIAQYERNIRELEAQLPVEEQLSLKLRRLIEVNIPELTVKVRVEEPR